MKNPTVGHLHPHFEHARIQAARRRDRLSQACDVLLILALVIVLVFAFYEHL